jgi:adenosylcobinamide kinase/adenosylcobinamide-phosphate guanylyltransferase
MPRPGRSDYEATSFEDGPSMRSLITGRQVGQVEVRTRLAEEFSEPRYFLATAEAFDDEMKARIAGHRKERQDVHHDRRTSRNRPKA